MYYLKKEKVLDIISKKVAKNLNLQNAFTAIEKVFPGRWDFQITLDLDYDWFDKDTGYVKEVGFTGFYDKDGNYVVVPLNNLKEFFSKEFTIYFNFIIYFPEITISNGRIKHTIKDLYVELKSFWKNKSYETTGFYLNGIRGSITLEEYERGYFHSHLPGVRKRFEAFCLGSGPLSNLYYDFDINNSTEDWQYIFTLVNDYVRWESISGRPYNRIDNIGMSSVLNPIPDHVISQIIKTFNFTNLSCKIDDSGIVVTPTEELEKDIVNKLLGTSYEQYLCYRNNNGEYLTKNQCNKTSQISNLVDAELFTFKGETIKFKIIDSKYEYNKQFEINAPYQKLTEAICNHYSKRITEAYIRRSAVAEENPIEDTSTSIGESEVFVL